jgi:hypothetical protein
MSNPIQSVPTPMGEFQAHFGGPPGSSDLAAECKKWENLCADLLAQREKLRAELAQMCREFDICKKSLYHLVFKNDAADFDLELALSHIDDKPTLEELIAQLEHAPGK